MEEFDYESDVKLAEYLVVPRPRELIQSQLKASSKSKDHKTEPVLKESLLKNVAKKLKEKSTKERLGKTKDAKKSVAKARSVLSSARVSKKPSKTVTSKELSDKFDSHLQEAKKSLSRYRFNKSDAVNEDTEKPTVEHSNQEQQLLKTMEEPAFSEQERYDVLNARDSYMRLREAKSGVPKSKIIFGTCPDMCPEKERYSRIAKNCLALFEMKKGMDPTSNSKEVVHSYMIKEYSRSSADQQEPLPHELRPVPVLMSTMDYLICNIIDKIENSSTIADWYDFVWNRTRSIRKDITQQQLCDMECVDILEKCARFHILCAEALSEEDRATFDPKINNENLTKCLQTLKHMYHDLLSKGVQCPNEAEFRAYDILLSLNEGETLRLVKDIRKEIFKSPLVKSAFEAALALKSNNYVKFFKLMENATYLSSCIMHRYIHEARVHAIQVIIRAYSLQNNPTTLPLASLVKDLRFEDSADAANFCRWHGLNADESNVTIQRQTFLKPADAYPITRVSSLVQQKMSTGLGVIVNNGPLPENPLNWYKPQNSFSEEGILLDKIVPTFENEDFSEIREDDNFDVDMEFESTPVIPPIEHVQKKDISFENSAAKSSQEIGNNFSEFKVKTFENFLNKSQSQTKKADVFSFFSTDSHNLKSNILKSELLKEKPPPESIPISAIAKRHSNAGTFFTPVEKSSQPEIAPQMKTEKIPLSHFHQTAEQKVPKTSNFQSLFQTKGKSPMMKSTFGNKPTSFFSRTSNQDISFSAKKLSHTPLNENKEDSVKKPVSHSLGFFKSSITAASKTEVEPLNSISSVTFLKPLDSLQNIHKTDDFHSKNSETVEINRFRHVETPPLEESESLKSIAKEDDANEELYQEEFKSDEDSDDDENSGMSMEDDETLKKIREEKINELVLDVEDEIYSHCVKELSIGICKKVLNEEWEIKNHADAYIHKMKLNLARKALYKWKLFCERKKQRNIYKNCEPLSPWVPMLMNTAYVTSGATSPFTVYKKHCSLTRLADSKLKETKPGWEPLQASHFDLLNKQLPPPPAYLQTSGISRFFKLGVVFASYPEGSVSQFIAWMFKKLKLPVLIGNESKMDNLASIYTLNAGKTVVCVKAIVLGSQDIGDCNGFMDGLSAMILCCPARFPALMPFKAFLDKFSTLLKDANLLSTFPIFTFPIELKQKCNVLCQLASFLDERHRSGNCFSAVKMNHLSEACNYKSNSRDLEKAIQWLVENQEPLPVLLSSSLQHYLEDSYASAFNTVFWKISLQEFKPLVMLPQHIINLYNKMLDSRAKLLRSEYLMAVNESWPPSELYTLRPDFRTINKLFQEKAANLIESNHLPEFVGNPSTLEDLWCYVRKIGGLSGNNAMLFISVQNILENNRCVDWPTIISKCAYHIICGNSLNNRTDLKESVYYMKEDLDSLTYEPFWQSLMSELKKHQVESIKRKVAHLWENSPKRKRSVAEQEEAYDSFDSNPDFGNISVISNIPDASSCHVEDMLSNLKSALKKQNEESDRFLLKLNESISGSLKEEDSPQRTFNKDTSLNTPFLVQESTSSKEAHDVENLLPKSCLHTTERLPSAGTNSWDKFVKKSNSVEVATPASISEKLAELRYNIQKNNILEDNLSFLLNL